MPTTSSGGEGVRRVGRQLGVDALPQICKPRRSPMCKGHKQAGQTGLSLWSLLLPSVKQHYSLLHIKRLTGFKRPSEWTDREAFTQRMVEVWGQRGGMDTQGPGLVGCPCSSTATVGPPPCCPSPPGGDLQDCGHPDWSRWLSGRTSPANLWVT